MFTKSFALRIVTAAALFGCGSPPPAAVDGGGPGTDAAVAPPDTGGSRRDAPMVERVCASPRAIMLTLGRQMITGDTTGRGNDQMLGMGCGSADMTRAPQEALALTLPGSGELGVRFTFENAGTAETFDTIFQLRRDACDSLASAEGCQEWDDIAFPDRVRSQGQFIATGGDTVYGIVSGFATANAGPWQMDVEVLAITPPTETAASVVRIDMTRFDIDVMGGDTEGDADGIRVSFLDGSGAVIGLDTDGMPATPDQTEFEFGFLQSVAGMMTFSARSRVNMIGDFPALVTAAQARVSIVDAFGLVSASMMVPITDAMESGRGEMCGTGYVCADAFTCAASMTCESPPATVAACAGATPIALVPGAATTTASVMGSIPAARGDVIGSCGNTEGAEVLYTVMIPAADPPALGYDLVATTDTTTTGDADTVLYVQQSCGDPSTEGGRCNDDIAMMNTASQVDSSTGIGAAMGLPAGAYTIAVEAFGVAMAAVPFGMDVSLRPVLPRGQPCDPAGIMNRCAAGSCVAGVAPMCP